MSLETHLQKLLLLAAPERLQDLRLFRRNVGETRMPSGAVVQYAIKGQCDLYGYLRGGQGIEIELKNVGKKIEANSDQDRWRAFCESWGIPHIVLTAQKGETEQQTIDRWCNELAAFISRVV